MRARARVTRERVGATGDARDRSVAENPQIRPREALARERGDENARERA